MIGLTRANDLLLTSRVVLAEEALTMGLINAVLPADELMAYTYNYVRKLIATVSPGSLRVTKRQIYTDLYRDVRAAVAHATEQLERMATEPDFVEGVSAFWRNARRGGGNGSRNPRAYAARRFAGAYYTPPHLLPAYRGSHSGVLLRLGGATIKAALPTMQARCLYHP